jgi:hypothetical protein
MKASTIMVCPLVHLPSHLTDAERDVLRKVLLDNIRGIDRVHDKRWRRFVGGLINSDPGEVTSFINPCTRSMPAHKRWMAIERAIFDNQEGFPTFGGFRRWLKCGAELGEYQLVEGRMVFVPGSVSFDEASNDEMLEFVKRAEEFLRTPLAQRRLWRHLPPQRRADMVETLLRNPNEHEEST